MLDGILIWKKKALFTLGSVYAQVLVTLVGPSKQLKQARAYFGLAMVFLLHDTQ